MESLLPSKCVSFVFTLTLVLIISLFLSSIIETTHARDIHIHVFNKAKLASSAPAAPTTTTASGRRGAEEVSYVVDALPKELREKGPAGYSDAKAKRSCGTTTTNSMGEKLNRKQRISGGPTRYLDNGMYLYDISKLEDGEEYLTNGNSNEIDQTSYNNNNAAGVVGMSDEDDVTPTVSETGNTIGDDGRFVDVENEHEDSYGRGWSGYEATSADNSNGRTSRFSYARGNKIKEEGEGDGDGDDIDVGVGGGGEMYREDGNVLSKPKKKQQRGYYFYDVKNEKEDKIRSLHSNVYGLMRRRRTAKGGGDYRFPRSAPTRWNDINDGAVKMQLQGKEKQDGHVNSASP